MDETRGINPEEIKQDEAEWISKASIGGMIWAEKYQGKGYKYDITSHYPAIMSNTHSIYPIKRGNFKIIKNEDIQKFAPTGIYHCKITGVDKRLFRDNFENYYTNRDIEHARSLGGKVDLIQDGKPNMLEYPRKTHCITGSELFGKYVETIFELKKQGIKMAKNILNILWGLLCEKDDFHMKFNRNSEFQINDGMEMVNIVPINEDEYNINLAKKNKTYKTPYARIAPFLLSNGRQKIANVIKPNIDKIVRVHTDGFVSKEKLEYKFGKELGDLKYEGYCETVNVKNCIDIGDGEWII